MVGLRKISYFRHYWPIVWPYFWEKENFEFRPFKAKNWSGRDFGPKNGRANKTMCPPFFQNSLLMKVVPIYIKSNIYYNGGIHFPYFGVILFFELLPFGSYMSKTSLPRVILKSIQYKKIFLKWPSKVPRKKNSTFLKFKQANWKGFFAKKSSSGVISCSYKHQKVIVEKTGLLQNIEHGCLHFNTQ